MVEWAPATTSGKGKRARRFFGIQICITSAGFWHSLLNQAIFDAWNYTCSHTYCEWMVREATHIHNWPGSRNWIEVKAAPAPGIVSRCFTMFHVTMSECPSSRHANKEWTNCCSSSQRSSLVSWRNWIYVLILSPDADPSVRGFGVWYIQTTTVFVIRKWDRWATLSINGNTKKPSNCIKKPFPSAAGCDPVAFPYAKDVLENIHQTWTFVLVSSGLCLLLFVYLDQCLNCSNAMFTAFGSDFDASLPDPTCDFWRWWAAWMEKFEQTEDLDDVSKNTKNGIFPN